jgi:hypothetical protein
MADFTQSIEAYRTRHQTAPGTPDEHGTVRCIVDGFRVVQDKRGKWRHDVTPTAPTTGFPR